jgi:hypothetical protein
VQHRAGILVGPLGRDSHNCADILRFILTFEVRRRRSKKSSMSTACLSFLALSRRALLAWFSKLADKSVLAAHLNDVASTEQSGPSCRFNRPTKRVYTQVSVEEKWSILERARSSHASTATVLAVRSDSSALGGDGQQGCRWQMKEHEMYWNACGIGLSGDGARHSPY